MNNRINKKLDSKISFINVAKIGLLVALGLLYIVQFFSIISNNKAINIKNINKKIEQLKTKPYQGNHKVFSEEEDLDLMLYTSAFCYCPDKYYYKFK